MSGAVGIDLSQGAAAFGVLAIRGADAARFLQGQLSADIASLAVGASTFAGLHNPQGRVLALLAVTRAAVEDFYAVLPRELVAMVAQQLGKFVLRSKLRIDDDSPSTRVLGSWTSANDPGIASIGWGDRRLLLVPAAHDFRNAEGFTAAMWEGIDVRAGIPQVYSATSAAFIAQMLNLDLLGAIAFDKGCYTGQEIIARAHYRGRVKRRMQRWHNGSEIALQPGEAAHTADGRALTVVRVGFRDSKGDELLAVGNFTAGEASAAGDGTATAGPLVTGPLPLPYSLPE